MRLLVEGDLKPAGGIIGVWVDEMKWTRAVRPADELEVEAEVPVPIVVPHAAAFAARSCGRGAVYFKGE